MFFDRIEIMMFKTVPEDVKFESAEWVQKLVEKDITENGLSLNVEVEVLDEGSIMVWFDDGTFLMLSYSPEHDCIQPVMEYEDLEKRMLMQIIVIDEHNVYHSILRNIHETLC